MYYEEEENPLSRNAKIGIGVAVAAAVYFVSRPAAASPNSSQPGASAPTTYILSASTPTLSIVDTTGIVLQLPPGATWAAGSVANALVGTNTPITLPVMPPGTSAQTVPVYWTDVSGKPQTTTITFSVGT